MSTASKEKKISDLKWRIIKGFGTIRAYTAPRELAENRFSEMLNGKRPMPDDLLIRVERDLKKAKV